MQAYDFTFEAFLDHLKDKVGEDVASYFLPYENEKMVMGNYPVIGDDELKELGLFKEYDSKTDLNPDIKGFKFPTERDHNSYKQKST